jgi:uncharacterized membrane protein YeaQ/YmgE (transglycosylase-associated protein family)
MTLLFWILLVVVLVAAFGAGAVLGFTWMLLWYVVVGLILGALARLLVRGTGGMGLGATVLAGITGSLLGGMLADWVGVDGALRLVVAVLVAAIAVAALAPITRRRP